MQAPIPFSPAVETPEPDEAQTIQELVETLLKISRTTYEDGHHALRSVHAKSHALLEGELTVLPNLPPELAQGIFAVPSVYPVILRLSSTPGDLLDDSVSTPRGLALKVIGVRGARLAGSEADATQDFIMINGPAFAAPNAKKFLGNLKLLAGTTDKVPHLKSVLSATLRGAEKLLESVGGHSGTLHSLGGEPATHPLGETYFTQVPLRFGQYIGKLSLAPASDRMRALKGAPVPITKSPQALREALQEFQDRFGDVGAAGAVVPGPPGKCPWRRRRGLARGTQPPHLPIGRLFFPRQSAWNESRSRAVDEGIAFSPWHGIEEHQPLGSVMRARKAAYEASVRFRAEHNAQPIEEPDSSPGLSDG